MPFGKKSQDPWDRKPDRPRPESREPREPLLDSLKAWNDRRKAAEAQRAAPDLPAEPCPWCGRDMEQGYMVGGRESVCWYPGRLTTKAAWLGRRDVKGLNLLDEENFIHYKTVWLCRDCKKMIFRLPEPEEETVDEEEESGS